MKSLSNFFLWNNPKNFANSSEEILRKEKAYLLPYSFASYNSNENIFSLIRAAILLEGFYNKSCFEFFLSHFTSEQLQFNADSLYTNLKYFVCDGEKIYLPFFSKDINRLFLHLSDLKDSKYSDLIQNPKKYYIDPFIYYNNLPFDSLFSRLILINDTIESKFFYHVELQTIVVIDEHGELENEFPIFDEKIKKDNDDLFKRIYLSSLAYYQSSSLFLSSLKENRLISDLFYQQASSFNSKHR